ncbi:flavodoxin [Candidatus Bathyarchaeota archaeon]|nr:flavodoxin [Candidatus Bathyarchaeota archaeon]
MNFLVVYYSKGGKTRKIAEIIAHELDCEAVDLTKETPNVSEVDMLIVGSGNYGGKPDRKIQNFIDSLHLSIDRKAAVFATSGGSECKCIHVMEEDLKIKGYKVVSGFYCLGQFTLLNRGHPNEDDLKNARRFANQLKKN